MSVERDYFGFGGGLDLVSPYLGVKAGRLIEALNYEALPRGGYRRIDGYALYDGHAGPAAVPGAGAILGVWVYEGVLYAFRNNAGNTAVVMHKATGAGWAAQSLGEYLLFTGGNDANSPIEGSVITGLVSGATATVRRVLINGGTFGGANATGLYVISGRVGNFQNGENLQVGGVNKAVANGTQVVASLPPGGRYEFVNHNFFASTATKRMYGVNGVGYGFEWDGTYFTPLIHGSAVVFPTHVTAHKDKLFHGYPLGTAIHSGDGDPLSWIAADGAAEIGFGDEITALQPLRGGLLFIGCEESGFLLYGNDSADWEKKKFVEHGVRPSTTAEVGTNVLALDEVGVQNLLATQSFGDYTSILVSFDIAKALRALLTGGTTAVSVHSQNLDQYRLFFAERGYYFTFNGNRLAGIMPVEFDHPVRCACRGLTTAGAEVMFYGSDSGNVFQMNTTNYFNGQPVFALMRLPFVYEDSPTQRKQFRYAEFDMKVEGAPVSLGISAEFDFGLGRRVSDADVDADESGGGSWGVAIWAQFEWSLPFYSGACFTIEGTGKNMSLCVVSNGAEDASHTFYGVVLHYSKRKLMRVC